MARAQSGPSSCKPHTLAPGRPTPASASGAAALVSSWAVFSSSALDVHRRLVVSTLIKIQASQERAGLQRPADGMSGFSQMLCVCPRAEGEQMTTDLGAPVSIDV